MRRVMANRHHHKKLRAEIRSRMTRTGESYQTALQRIAAMRSEAFPRVDLVPVRFFGLAMMLATSESAEMHSVAVLGQTLLSGGRPALPLAVWLRPQGLN